ncbi:MAG: hydroxyphenylacetyl-CoA thioesterase PaaI [Saprospiraceae bacterium]
MSPREIVENGMYGRDAFSKWLGIELIDVQEGYAKVKMTVRPEMTNGFHIAHGGISYSLADSCFAFASNSHGRHAVSIETSISHTKAIFPGDILIAESQLENLSNKLGIYTVKVTNQKDEIVALFKGTVFRKENVWTINN